VGWGSDQNDAKANESLDYRHQASPVIAGAKPTGKRTVDSKFGWTSCHRPLAMIVILTTTSDFVFIHILQIASVRV
jgi:hypothetical protein